MASGNPSDEEIASRAWSLVNESMFAIDLQRRRVRSSEPEDERFAMRWWAELQFFVVALRRMRTAAALALRSPPAKDRAAAALRAFDAAVPALKTMRNVGEHLDAYAVDGADRHHQKVRRAGLQVGSFDGTTYRWLELQLNVDTAFDAAATLHRTMRGILK